MRRGRDGARHLARAGRAERDRVVVDVRHLGGRRRSGAPASQSRASATGCIGGGSPCSPRGATSSVAGTVSGPRSSPCATRSSRRPGPPPRRPTSAAPPGRIPRGRSSAYAARSESVDVTAGHGRVCAPPVPVCRSAGEPHPQSRERRPAGTRRGRLRVTRPVPGIRSPPSTSTAASTRSGWSTQRTRDDVRAERCPTRPLARPRGGRAPRACRERARRVHTAAGRPPRRRARAGRRRPASCDPRARARPRSSSGCVR